MDASEITFLEKEISHVFSEKEKSILTVRDGEVKKQAGKGILFVGSKKVRCTIELTPIEAALWFEKKKLNEIIEVS